MDNQKLLCSGQMDPNNNPDNDLDDSPDNTEAEMNVGEVMRLLMAERREERRERRYLFSQERVYAKEVIGLMLLALLILLLAGTFWFK